MDRAKADKAVRQANREAEIRAQHGPVKVLVKGGKKVDERD